MKRSNELQTSWILMMIHVDNFAQVWSSHLLEILELIEHSRYQMHACDFLYLDFGAAECFLAALHISHGDRRLSTSLVWSISAWESSNLQPFLIAALKSQSGDRFSGWIILILSRQWTSSQMVAHILGVSVNYWYTVYSILYTKVHWHIIHPESFRKRWQTVTAMKIWRDYFAELKHRTRL